ncbi:MAG TPA: hypothetical protein VFV96_08130 [Verrucomicrobiae bacterium]|nr:hypothetical protein [Verrucomicrobiae bacterium]
MTTPVQTDDSAFRPVDDAVCDQCGRFGALRVNERWLCEDCYSVCGSCCAEFEGKPKKDADVAQPN